MSVSLVMTVLSKDQQGIVEALSGVIEAHAANWEESRMASLSGQFAGVLRARCPDEEADRLKQALLDLQDQGLSITIHAGSEADASPNRMTLQIGLTGHDQPGIISSVTQAIHAYGANIEELVSECAGAPLSAGPLFTAQLRLSAAPDTSLDDLRDDLERVSADLMVDISVESPES
ncbi:MAG: glycine cleavage system protein R [Verrucomicrobia bacterium]|nr:glycine cleavage system protein R [Verrucomicrobiota bacterium]MDA1085911.1 glycine cleavage system protein R [Verrucomicrobiota bacterium]